MNDIKELLDRALPPDLAAPAVDPAGSVVDPSADLARGRRLLRRRRWYGCAGVAAAAAAGGLVAVSLQGPSHPAVISATPTRLPGHTGQPVPHRVSTPAIHLAVRLVHWDGRQPPGYQVAWMPAGWVIQGGNQFSLTIAPAGFADTNPDSFVGKLVVMLQSADATGTPPGTAQPVNGRPGYFQPVTPDSAGLESLTYQIAGGRWMVVQAPATLGWNGPDLAKFATGVQVLPNAQPGHG